MEKQQDRRHSESVLPIDEHEEFVSEGGKRVRRQGIYLLPNLLTLGALFSGFYAIIAGMGGDFNAAGWAILIASIFDGLDGRVARLTGTQSAFGAQFDSLSDMVSFGMAPALIAFSWGLSSLGNPGWAAAFIFMSCAALRLARFNVQLGTVSKRFFVGLQSPVAAGLVTFCVWVGALYNVRVTPTVAYSLAAVTVLAGLLMVSNYRYFSFKEMHFRGTVPYVVFLSVVALLVLIAQNPHETLLTMCVLYALSGPVLWIYRRQGREAGPAGSASSRLSGGSADPDTGKPDGPISDVAPGSDRAANAGPPAAGSSGAAANVAAPLSTPAADTPTGGSQSAAGTGIQGAGAASSPGAGEVGAGTSGVLPGMEKPAADTASNPSVSAGTDTTASDKTALGTVPGQVGKEAAPPTRSGLAHDPDRDNRDTEWPAEARHTEPATGAQNSAPPVVASNNAPPAEAQENQQPDWRKRLVKTRGGERGPGAKPAWKSRRHALTRWRLNRANRKKSASKRSLKKTTGETLPGRRGS